MFQVSDSGCTKQNFYVNFTYIKSKVVGISQNTNFQAQILTEDFNYSCYVFTAYTGSWSVGEQKLGPFSYSSIIVSWFQSKYPIFLAHLLEK